MREGRAGCGCFQIPEKGADKLKNQAQNGFMNRHKKILHFKNKYDNIKKAIRECLICTKKHERAA